MKLSEIKEYLFSLRHYILFSSLLFAMGVYSGYIFPQEYPEETRKLVEELKSIFLSEGEIGSWEIFILVLENNIMKLLGVLTFGILAGVIPMAASFINGAILGIFAYLTSESLSWEYFLAGILPHGILEIPALILATAIGMKIGKVGVWRLFSKKYSFKKEFIKGLKFYISVLAPMIFIAALIEAFITPFVMSFFASA